MDKKIVGVIIPYWVSVIFIFIILSISEKKAIVEIPDLIANITIIPLFTGMFTYVEGAHWYMAYLVLFFIMYSAFYLIAKIFKNHRFIDCCMIIYGIVFLISHTFFREETESIFIRLVRLIFNEKLIFIILGYFINKVIRLSKDRTNVKEKMINLSFLLFFIIETIFVIIESFFWINIIYYILGLLIIILCMLDKIKLLEFKPFIAIGQVSLWIYLLHQELGYKFLSLFDSSFYLLAVVLAIILFICLAFLFDFIYRKIRKHY